MLCRRDRQARVDLLLGGQDHVSAEAAAQAHTLAGHAGRDAAPMGGHLPDRLFERHLLYPVGHRLSDRHPLLGVSDSARRGSLEDAGRRLRGVHRAAYRRVDRR